jgi:NAD(P)H-dependent FMN reductase
MPPGLWCNEPMKLLIFAGSTRQNSWNRKLARVAAAMARRSGAEVTHLELADLDVLHVTPTWKRGHAGRCDETQAAHTSTRPGSSARPNTTPAIRPC